MEVAESTSLTRDSPDLPRPPAHGKYDLNNKAKRQNGNLIKCFCIAFFVVLLLALAINAIILLVAFKKAEAPQFQVKNVQVSKFSIANPYIENTVLSTNLDFFFEADNKNPMIGFDLGNMVLETTWDEVKAHLGETHVENFAQKSKGVSILKVSTKGEVTISNKSVKKEDMKLDLVLSGQLKYFAGPFKTERYPFIVSCNDISTLSNSASCNTKLFTKGESPPARSAKPMLQPESQAPSVAPIAPVEEVPTLQAPGKTPLAPIKEVPPEQAPGRAPVEEAPPQQTPRKAPIPPIEEMPPQQASRKAPILPIEKMPPSQAPVKSPTMPVEKASPILPPIESFPPVKLTIQDKFVILDNGFLAATIAKPDGFVTGIKYNGMDNILDEVNPEDDRGYWDVVWAPPGTKGTKGTFLRIVAKDFRVMIDRPDQIELSFKLGYNPVKATKKDVPLEIDQRYIMLRGVSGLYSYGIFERAAWPAFGMPNARLAFKLQRQKFKYMVVADDRQREMPVPEDRMKPRGEELAYPEAVLLVDPIDPQFKGEVDDKYQYSMESQDVRVHGWICKDPPTGFWQITPSYEFRSGGPNKQFLTSHVGPSTLAMFVSAHYSGEELVPRFAEGEPWSHIYGPIFMYMNNGSKGEDFHLLWDDAKERMLAEVNSWPYSFPASEDFPKANERVNVFGRFFVHDKFLTREKVPAKGAFIGLGPPGVAGSWQRDCKTYQFWTQTNDEGYFNITSVRVGNYNVFGWVNGYIGDFKHDKPINIIVGQNVDLGELVFEPPRDGPTLWEIGIPDRLAKEFHIPDPNPKYVNKLYVNHPDRFRQYGLWERYAELYPKDDLIYDVNTSDYKKDWFFAHVTRQIGAEYNGTTWQVKFNLDNVEVNGVYKLRVAIASATNSDLEVRFNEPKPSLPIFTTGRIGNDNSIARHGVHGLYWLYHIDVKGNQLKKGSNTLFLTQTKGTSAFQGIMYDYIRLEGPSISPK